jgi:hypothetical protein
VLAFIPALGADVALRWMIFVADTSARLPFSATTVVAFPAWVAAAVYIPLTYAAVKMYKKNSTN